MPRRIVICIDGTNNYPNGGYTNIQRLLRMLKRDQEQLTYYQSGVGTIEPSSVTTRGGRKLAMLLDSMSAVMLKDHVCSAYRFLMSEYQEGDEICLFGFSRGAYSVRVLAAMLTTVGLLQRGFDSLVPFAWSTYLATGEDDKADEDGDGEAADGISVGLNAARAFRNNYARFIGRIAFIGLFDTVSAVGLPWVPKVFPRTFDNPRVVCVRHALSLDEHRVMFVQNRWKEAQIETEASTDVRQVWFSGVHSDVGGGYPEGESGLSLIPLAWMVREAQARGLTFKPQVSARILDPTHQENNPTVEFVTGAQAAQPVHDELPRRLIWGLLERLPVPRRRRNAQLQWSTEWVVNQGRARHPGERPRVHESVRLRMQQGYQPRAQLLDPQFEW